MNSQSDFETWSKLIGELAVVDELQDRRNREQQFATDAGYDFNYGRYWETMTLQELRDVQLGKE